MNDDLHILYRMFTGSGALLYVGITNDMLQRYSNHKSTKAWIREVDRIELQYFASRDELEEAERNAIKFEGPRYNIRMPGVRRTPRKQRTQRRNYNSLPSDPEERFELLSKAVEF